MRGRLLLLRLHACKLSALLGLGLAACGEDELQPQDAFGPYADRLVDFVPGAFAGFGRDELPDVVLGPPGGTFDVLSLGVGGSVTVGFDFEIVDEPGPDFVVFENAFLIDGGPLSFSEPGRVEVSLDGESFASFSCTPEAPFIGCAGVTPTGDATLDALDPMSAGGDAFDLAVLGLEAIRYVRLVDNSTTGEGITAGFDLDAVGAFHRRD
ncbi:MAG: cell surface protein [Myxococcota bacterium]